MILLALQTRMNLCGPVPDSPAILSAEIGQGTFFHRPDGLDMGYEAAGKPSPPVFNQILDSVTQNVEEEIRRRGSDFYR